MSPERWQQIDSLLQAVLARPADERSAFLRQACAGDEALRQEVDSLLSFHQQADNFIETPPVEVAADWLALGPIEAMPERVIGPYQLLREIGRGGMGVVYLARDTRLSRRVALKLLPPRFTSDEERLRRFRREARAASALSHPNILTVYEVGEVASVHFIATEFVDGQTLRAALIGAGLELSKALDLMIQVASALAAAHEAGIVHRDLKPENIMVRPDGIVKVLDFGLAKLTDQAQPLDVSFAKIDTEPGVVMGTVSYMSPEQARGLEVDARSDIFSLGVVLYETIAGHSPFAGETVSDVIAALLGSDPPPITNHVPGLPSELQRIISRALAKQVENRYQAAQEVLSDLRDLKQELEFVAKLNRAAAGRDTYRTMKTDAAAGTEDVYQTTYPTRGAAARTRSALVTLFNFLQRRSRRVALALAVIVLLIAGVAMGRQWLATRDGAIKSIAVLPFVNVGSDPQMEYLPDGITESIIQSLSQLPELRVMARSTVFTYKGREVDPRQIGEALRVGAIVTGQVQRQGERLIVRAELVDASDGSRLWGEQYERQFAEIFGVQEAIAREISEKLRLRLSGGQKQQLAKRYTADPDAYQLYLIGRYFWNKRTEEGLKKGIEYFEQAIRKDPSYTLAYAGLADSYIILSRFSLLRPDEAYPRAREAAVRAIHLDEAVAEAHTSLAVVKMDYDWDLNWAEREFKRALELNPGYSVAHQWYGVSLAARGQFEEAISEMKQAQDLDPLSLIINAALGWMYYYARQYNRAIERELKTLEIDPQFERAYGMMADDYEVMGQYDEAVDAHLKLRGLQGGDSQEISSLRAAFAKAGWRGFLRKRLELLRERARHRYVPPYDFAVLHAALGEQDQAFAELERAYTEHHFRLIFLKVEPKLDSLRADPRFIALMRRVGLSP